MDDPDEWDQESGQLDAADTLDAATSPTRWTKASPRPSGRGSATGGASPPASRRRATALDRYLARELPDVAPTTATASATPPTPTASRGTTRSARSGPVVSSRRTAGRADTDDELWAHDIGVDGAAASAEEAAMHVVGDRSPTTTECIAAPRTVRGLTPRRTSRSRPGRSPMLRPMTAGADDAHLIDLASRALGGQRARGERRDVRREGEPDQGRRPDVHARHDGPARPDLRRLGDPPPPRRGLRLGDRAARGARRGAPGRRRHRVLPRQLPGGVRHRDVLARRLARHRRAGRAAVLADEGGAAEARGRHGERHRDPADAGHPRAAHDPPGRRGGPAAGARRGGARPAALGRADRRPRGGGQRRHRARRQRPVLLPARERDPAGARGDDGRRLGDPPAPRRRLRLAAARAWPRRGRSGSSPSTPCTSSATPRARSG